MLFRLGFYETRSITYARRILEVLAVIKDSGKVVLDLGCGSGFFSRLVGLAGFKVIALDIDCEALRRVNSRFNDSSILPLCADAQVLPLRKDSVDLVIALSIYEHLENLQIALKETARILRRGGILVVQLPNLDYFIEPHTKFPMFLIPRRYKNVIAFKLISYHVNWDANPKKLIKMAAKNKLEFIRMIKHYHKLRTAPWPPSWFLIFAKR